MLGFIVLVVVGVGAGGLLAAIFGRGVGRMVGALAATTVGLLVFAVLSSVFHHGHGRSAEWDAEQIAQLRTEYPLMSIAARLSHETKDRAGDEEPVALAPAVETRLADDERHRADSPRAAALREAHAVAAPAAGDVGYRNTSSYLFHLAYSPVLRSIGLTELPKKSGCDHKKEPVQEYVPQPSGSTLPMLALTSFHHDAVGDLLHADRMGYVQDAEHVAGFEPHAFHHVPVLHASPNDAALKLEKLELIGLTKRTGPTAYVSENYPRLDELQKADTRLLHDFETRALAQLRSEEDTVIEETDGAVRMLGALRAGNDCTRCHTSMRRGELIGALSYEFQRKTPANATEVSPLEVSPLVAGQ